MNEAILSLRGVSLAFNGMLAVNAVDLDVAPGEFRAIIGPNGAGKSTLFNLICGTYTPSMGRVLFKGEDVTGLPPHVMNRKGISRTFQINNVFNDMTVRNNIRLAVTANHRKSWAMTTAAVKLYDDEVVTLAASCALSDQLEVIGRELPYGDRRRLELAIALASRPELLLLDEPTSGVAMVERPALITLVRRIVRSTGMAAILVEHDMEIGFAVADRILVLSKGQSIADDVPEAIARSRDVQQIYLGDDFVA
jgi:branched-chain amino acid transport system ATP-binding protein